MKSKTIETKWEVWTYDVWGNARDGYEVNDRYNQAREYPLTLKVTVCNAGTPQEFEHATPSDRQLRVLFGLGKTRIETDGDDVNIYVNRCRDSFPVGELRCVSHDSLSPIREAKS